MIIPRDTSDGYTYMYSPWGSWGRWVLLAVVVIIVICIIASFFARTKQHNARQDIPLAPVYPQDPTNGNQNPPPPIYQPDGTAYMGPVWHGPQQHVYGEKGYGDNYGPPPGPPPPNGAGSSYMYGPPSGPPPPSASNGASTSDFYDAPVGAPPGHSSR